MRVVNIGSLNIDYVYEVPHFVQPGETLSSRSLRVNCGGKGLNQSIAAAKAGLEVYHAGCIGEEGVFLKEKLAAAGVRTDCIRQVAGKTGHAIIQVDPSGQNNIILYSGANHALTEEDVDRVLAWFDRGDMVLLQNETSCVDYIVRRAWELGMRTALNAAPSGENLQQVPLEKLEWLLVNEVEGAYLTGTTDPREILRRLGERCPDTTIVLTLGGDGSMAARGGETVQVPAMRVQAVDTTAAGDTFTGYFLRRAAEGGSLEECLRLATAASALAVTRPGAADSIPAYDEVQAFLQA